MASVALRGGGGGGNPQLLGSSLTPLSGTTEAATGINSIPPAWTQIITAAAMSTQAVGWALQGTIENGDPAATKAFFQLAIGAAGAEVSIAQGKFRLPAGVGSVVPLSLSSNQIIAAGTRVAFRCWVEGGTAGTVMFGWTVPRRA